MYFNFANIFQTRSIINTKISTMSKNIGTEEKRQGTMSKTELAALYFPHISPANALRSFMRLINNHPGLMEELEKANYRKNSHVLTPRQVNIIIQNLGDPEYYLQIAFQ
jgi:hypothetical protein